VLTKTTTVILKAKMQNVAQQQPRYHLSVNILELALAPVVALVFALRRGLVLAQCQELRDVVAFKRL
jgi:hypothetical protein